MNLIFPLLGLLYFENEENWRKTHLLVGKIWVPGGLLIAVLALLAPVKAGMVLFFSLTVIMVLIPFVFPIGFIGKRNRHPDRLLYL